MIMTHVDLIEKLLRYAPQVARVYNDGLTTVAQVQFRRERSLQGPGLD